MVVTLEIHELVEQATEANHISEIATAGVASPEPGEDSVSASEGQERNAPSGLQ